MTKYLVIYHRKYLTPEKGECFSSLYVDVPSDLKWEQIVNHIDTALSKHTEWTSDSAYVVNIINVDRL